MALALLGAVLFHFPLVALASESGHLVGYLFGTWAALIAAAAWIMERARARREAARPDDAR